MTRSNATHPMVGGLAETADGHQLGKVTEIRGDYFHVEAEKSAGHWFPLDVVSAAGSEQVILTFQNSDLQQHEVPVPPDEVDPAEGRAAILPAEEEQRASMLAELARQREQIHRDGIVMPDEGKTVGEPVEQELQRLTGDDAPVSEYEEAERDAHR